MCFMEEPSQFSMGHTAQSLTCSIMEKPHTGLDDCLRMLQACFRKRMSGPDKLHAADPVLRVEVVVGGDGDGAAVRVTLRLGQEGAAILATALLVCRNEVASLRFT